MNKLFAVWSIIKSIISAVQLLFKQRSLKAEQFDKSLKDRKSEFEDNDPRNLKDA